MIDGRLELPLTCMHNESRIEDKMRACASECSGLTWPSWLAYCDDVDERANIIAMMPHVYCGFVGMWTHKQNASLLLLISLELLRSDVFHRN